MKTLNMIYITLIGACILIIFFGCGCVDSECGSAQDKRTLSKVDESEVEDQEYRGLTDCAMPTVKTRVTGKP